MKREIGSHRGINRKYYLLTFCHPSGQILSTILGCLRYLLWHCPSVKFCARMPVCPSGYCCKSFIPGLAFSVTLQPGSFQIERESEKKLEERWSLMSNSTFFFLGAPSLVSSKMHFNMHRMRSSNWNKWGKEKSGPPFINIMGFHYWFGYGHILY